jgi:hypothetical protein
MADGSNDVVTKAVAMMATVMEWWWTVKILCSNFIVAPENEITL